MIRLTLTLLGVLQLCLLVSCGCLPATTEPVRITLPMASAGISDGQVVFNHFYPTEKLPQVGQPPGPEFNLHNNEVARTYLSKYNSHISRTSIYIIPGIFNDCLSTDYLPFAHPATTSHQTSSPYQWYIDSGFLPAKEISHIPVKGLLGSAQNAEIIQQWISSRIRQKNPERVILLAYSKGMADLAIALHTMERESRLPDTIKAVVSIAGALQGSPLADKLNPTYNRLSGISKMLGCAPSGGDEVKSLTRTDRITWLASHPLPDRIKYYSVSAVTDHESVAPALKTSFSALCKFNPLNDGQVLLEDSILPHSTFLGALHSDHWQFVLPLENHPNILVRALASGKSKISREDLFRGLIKYVLGNLDEPEVGATFTPLGIDN